MVRHTPSWRGQAGKRLESGLSDPAKAGLVDGEVGIAEQDEADQPHRAGVGQPLPNRPDGHGVYDDVDLLVGDVTDQRLDDGRAQFVASASIQSGIGFSSRISSQAIDTTYHRSPSVTSVMVLMP